MQLPVDEQPVNEPKDNPDNKPAPARVDERINLRRDIITVYHLTVLNYPELHQNNFRAYDSIRSRVHNIFFVLFPFNVTSSIIFFKYRFSI